MSEAATTTTTPCSAPAPNHCRACGHADPHDTPLIGAHSLRLCLECLRTNHYCSVDAMGYASLAYSRQSRIDELGRRLVDAANNLGDVRDLKERAEFEAADWCERARKADARVEMLVKGARRTWWTSMHGPLSFGFDPAGVAGDRSAVTVALSVEEYGRLTRELAEAKARITELQEAATRRVEEWREERRRYQFAIYGPRMERRK